MKVKIEFDVGESRFDIVEFTAKPSSMEERPFERLISVWANATNDFIRSGWLSTEVIAGNILGNNEDVDWEVFVDQLHLDHKRELLTILQNRISEENQETNQP